jgi:hypothetical protein
VRALVEGCGGEVLFVALDISAEEQERRLVAPGRGEFGKLQAVEVLRQHKPGFDACMAAMPAPVLRVEADATAPDEAARLIAARLGI